MELLADVDERVPLLDIDPVRIREVIANLVANALRYTPAAGSIHITATVAAPARGGSSVRVDVTDTGTGIAADVLPHVFDRFWKSPDSRGSGSAWQSPAIWSWPTGARSPRKPHPAVGRGSGSRCLLPDVRWSLGTARASPVRELRRRTVPGSLGGMSSSIRPLRLRSAAGLALGVLLLAGTPVSAAG